jgi:hypothetical protein
MFVEGVPFMIAIFSPIMYFMALQHMLRQISWVKIWLMILSPWFAYLPQVSGEPALLGEAERRGRRVRSHKNDSLLEVDMCGSTFTFKRNSRNACIYDMGPYFQEAQPAQPVTVMDNECFYKLTYSFHDVVKIIVTWFSVYISRCDHEHTSSQI